MRKVHFIKDEIKVFERMKDKEKTIDFLRDALDLVIREETLDQNRKDMTTRGH